MAVELKVLSGLPPYGMPARHFSATGVGGHSEGFVVEIRPGGAPIWVANFSRGLTNFHYLSIHPNSKDAFVVAGGQAYVVDPHNGEVVGMYGGAIMEAFRYPSRNAIVLNDQGLFFECIGPEGFMWRSRRVSWDECRDVSVEGALLRGEAWRYDGTWHPFEIDLETGNVTGGAYELAT